jgi:NADPH-dependent 2,4-dienoyl-CoA reductase/sulfur reductase-like enzyme
MNQVLVIGAGPGGLAAARSARIAGATVTLLDSSDSLGGQFWRHLPESRPSRRERILHHGWDRFQELASELTADPGCEIILGAHVWAVDAGEQPVVHAVIGEADGRGRERMSFQPSAIVLATGAHDRTLPFPGWDLPGVFTAGAAQALAKGERLAVGQRVVVAGAGPFLLPVAQSLAATGSRVVAVMEANRAVPMMRGWLPRAWQLLPAAGKGMELAGYLAGHIRHRIPYLLGRTVIAAHGTTSVESVTTARLDSEWTPIPGTEKTIAVDAVCVSHAFTPRLELALAAGCNLTDDRFVRVDRRQQTSVPGIYAVGELTGIGGVDLALAEGGLAGHYAAGASGTNPSLERKRAVFTGFAERIEAAHGIRRGWPAWLSETTIVCRCEEVSYGSLCKAAQTTESQSLRSLKLSMRAGLGICQGRVCGRTVEDLLAREAELPQLTDTASSDRRPIAVPIRIGELAAPAAEYQQK